MTEIQRYECLRQGHGDRQEYWLAVDDDFRDLVLHNGRERDVQAVEGSLFAQVRGFVGLTPYESHVLAFLLYWSAERAHVGLRGLGLSLETPILGTIPSRRTNARVLRHPESNENIVIFDDATILFARTYSELVAYLLPDVVSTRGGPSVAEKPWGTRRQVLKFMRGERLAIAKASELINSFVFDGRYLPQGIDTDGERTEFAHFLGEAALVFVLGHEFGHLLAGDLDPIPEGYRNLERRWFKKAESIEAERSWIMEHEADFFGLGVTSSYLSQEYGNKINSIYYLAGPFLFLQFWWLLERCIRFTVTGSPFPDDGEFETPTNARSHPPPANRFVHVLGEVADEIPLAKAFADLFLCLNIVLTEECVKQLGVALSEGRTLHPSWQEFREEEGL